MVRGSLAWARGWLIELLRWFFEPGTEATEGRFRRRCMADAKPVLFALMTTFGAAFALVIV
jgi:hypothetical protein